MKQLLLQSGWDREQLCWLEPSRRLVMSGEGGDGQQIAYYSLVSDEGLFPQLLLSLSKQQTLTSVKVHPFISADADVSLNHIFTRRVRFACMRLMQRSRLGQKQMALKVHTRIPARLQMSKNKNPPDDDERLVSHFILFAFRIVKHSCVNVTAGSPVG